ncbi:DUF4352 domain-containing protein [Streptodolium elevatio]|uniref:DUF4352 domain-containing protein n=1 Tax=Streptodolium elevatio TaxID=3157996 RepID=A0ABV3DT28_9ACTN
MTLRRIAAGAAAAVLGGLMVVGCQADKGEPKTEPKAQDAATLDCTDPNITMGEWQKRCASGAPGTGGATPTPSASSAAPSKTPEPTGEKVAKVGDTISLTGFEGVKLDATVVKIVDPATTDNEFMKPKSGMRLVAVQWRIANTGNVPVDSGPTSGSSLVDTEGQQFDPTYATTTAGPEFPSGAKIPPGESRLGVVAYEVPTGSKVVKIQYGANSGFARQTGQWTVS